MKCTLEHMELSVLRAALEILLCKKRVHRKIMQQSLIGNLAVSHLPQMVQKHPDCVPDRGGKKTRESGELGHPMPYMLR